MMAATCRSHSPSPSQSSKGSPNSCRSLRQELFGIDDPQTLFDVLLHLGTLVAVVWVYRDLLWRMTRATLGALVRPTRLGASYRERRDFRLFVLVCLGMVPTGVISPSLRVADHTRSRRDGP